MVPEEVLVVNQPFILSRIKSLNARQVSLNFHSLHNMIWGFVFPSWLWMENKCPAEKPMKDLWKENQEIHLAVLKKKKDI